MQTCIWPSWCHCHSLSLASVKSRLVLPFWHWLTRVVPGKGPLNGCVRVSVSNQLQQWSKFCTNFSPKKWRGSGDASPVEKSGGHRPPRPRPTTPLICTRHKPTALAEHKHQSLRALLSAERWFIAPATTAQGYSMYIVLWSHDDVVYRPMQSVSYVCRTVSVLQAYAFKSERQIHNVFAYPQFVMIHQWYVTLLVSSEKWAVATLMATSAVILMSTSLFSVLRVAR